MYQESNIVVEYFHLADEGLELLPATKTNNIKFFFVNFENIYNCRVIHIYARISILQQ